MLVEATLDFPEEEIDFLKKADAQGQLDSLQVRLAQVLQRTRQGALLREGIRVVIAGQPNAGKSSLLNALAGAELAIVTPIAGTTRDVVQQTIQIEGVPLHVIDTAGLREGEDVDAVERIGIERAWGQIEHADAVLFLHDLTRVGEAGYAGADQEIAGALAERLPAAVPVIDIWNKADAAQGVGREGVVLSAKTGDGLQALRHRLLHEAGWQQASEGLYIARERHVQALLRVREHLELAQLHLAAQAQSLDLLAEELRQAQNALNEITGEFSADDLLGVIFSSFCIGK
jgi:tRNA modification GTPase